MACVILGVEDKQLGSKGLLEGEYPRSGHCGERRDGGCDNGLVIALLGSMEALCHRPELVVVHHGGVHG